ncbi:alpha/beta hydrolase [Fictibacillus iocasae]|uniref:Alpha/beta hydrolase n=1 Tax=Fictibacillus iocasae TaxID=2715437 RepID=A0ABW2NVA6_9BACL
MWTWKSSKEHSKGTVVLVHGAGEYHRRYEWVIRRLNESGYHCVMGDLPGQGTTTRRRGHINSFNDYIQEIEGWVHTAAGFGLPVFLFGHSMGGLAVIRSLMEKEMPVTAVVLSSPCLGLVNPPSKGKEALSLVLNKIAPSVKFSTNLPPGSGTRNEEMRMRDEGDMLLVKKVSVRWYRELTLAMKAAMEGYKRFPDVPLLVLQAGNDLIVDKDSVRQWFSAIDLGERSFKEFPDLYHEVLNEPEREHVYTYLEKFLHLHS